MGSKCTWPDPEYARREIIRLLGLNRTDKEICRELRCSQNQLRAKMATLGIRRRTTIKKAFALRLPIGEVATIEALAKRSRCSLNKMCCKLIAEAVEARKK